MVKSSHYNNNNNYYNYYFYYSYYDILAFFLRKIGNGCYFLRFVIQVVSTFSLQSKFYFLYEVLTLDIFAQILWAAVDIEDTFETGKQVRPLYSE